MTAVAHEARPRRARGASPFASGGRVHLVGVGGMALSAIAAILVERGLSVSGSDLQESSYTRKLREMGVAVTIDHRADAVEGAETVIFSAAVPRDNAELRRAAELGIPVLRRAEAIARLMDERRGVAVAGTHGKTTTTAMIAFIMSNAGLDPGYMVGAWVPDLNGNASWGSGGPFVVEADEFDSAFLEYSPEVAVLTHVEPDHLDYFGSRERMLDEFRQFVARVRPGGAVIARSGAELVRVATAGASARVVWFGDEGDWIVARFRPSGWGCAFELRAPSGPAIEARLAVPGLYNAYNAVAAVAAAAEFDVEPERAVRILAEFHGAERRFRVRARGRGITVVDDYAHHPTEVRAALAAARDVAPSRVWVVFQPHLRERTEDLFEEFTQAFGDADKVTIAEIFSPPGREGPTKVTGQDLARAIPGAEVDFQPTIEDCFVSVKDAARPGDLVVVMGAGDIVRLGDLLEEWLRG